VAGTLLHAFTGAGLVPGPVTTQANFALAMAGGAGLTVAMASWRGLPISTTHALIGAMTGAGLVVAGSSLHFATLGTSFLLPLLASPILAMLPAWLLRPVFRGLAERAARMPECVCRIPGAMVQTPDGQTLHMAGETVSDSHVACARHGVRNRWLRPDARGAVNSLLFLSGGAASFARGLNDTPKIAALLLPLASLDASTSTGLVGVAMMVGGLVGAHRVARTMSHRITRLDPGNALSASLTTALLVGTASFNGLPVSTTHVSVGALAGAGGRQGVDGRVLGRVIVSWVVTLPVGALLGAMCMLGLR